MADRQRGLDHRKTLPTIGQVLPAGRSPAQEGIITMTYVLFISSTQAPARRAS